MIDLHAHILPGLDDGAANFGESEAIFENARKAGITLMAATSHYSAEADRKYDEVLREISQKNPEIQFISGMEYDYDRLLDVADGKYRCLGNSRYLLIDLKCDYIPSGAKQLLFSLRMRNYKIILAHPERLWAGNIAESIKAIENPEFFFQVNAGSILGRYGKTVKKAAFYLLEHGKCSFFADDVHRAGGIFLAECREHLAAIYPEKLIERWFEVNPQRVLNNDTLLKVIPDPSFSARFARWRKIIRS